MAAGADAARWNHTAALMALIANCHRDPRRQRAFTPSDFHPERDRSGHERAAVPRTRDLTILRDCFVPVPPPPKGT